MPNKNNTLELKILPRVVLRAPRPNDRKVDLEFPFDEVRKLTTIPTWDTVRYMLISMYRTLLYGMVRTV